MICNYESCCAENSRKRCNECMSGAAVLIEIIGGLVFCAAVVLLFINGLLTSAGTIATAALISGLVYLGLLTVSSLVSKAGCISCNLPGIITGIFGTVFSSVIGTAITFTAGETLSAVVIGIIAFFLAYMIISTLFLIKGCIESR